MFDDAYMHEVDLSSYRAVSSTARLGCGARSTGAPRRRRGQSAHGRTCRRSDTPYSGDQDSRPGGVTDVGFIQGVRCVDFTRIDSRFISFVIRTVVGSGFYAQGGCSAARLPPGARYLARRLAPGSLVAPLRGGWGAG